MESYTLEKTGLELAGGRLVKKDKKGVVEASFDVAKIQHASVVEEIDPTAVVITIAVLGLTFVFYRFVPEGLWRWIAVIVGGAGFCACVLIVKSRFVVIEVGRDTLKYQSQDLPEKVPSFVAMINQAAEQQEPNKAPEPTPLPVTIPAEPGIAPGSGVAHL